VQQDHRQRHHTRQRREQATNDGVESHRQGTQQEPQLGLKTSPPCNRGRFDWPPTDY
jgi:hypothetical protein